MEEYKEFKDYWINNKTIIFKTEFDCELDNNYYEIIKKNEEIFFTSYNLLSETLKAKNILNKYVPRIKISDIYIL